VSGIKSPIKVGDSLKLGLGSIVSKDGNPIEEIKEETHEEMLKKEDV
jgi:hypothetical protein